MTNLDRQIEATLNEEDRRLFEELGEQGLIGQAKSAFRGKIGWVSTASVIVGGVLNIGFFYAAWQFFYCHRRG